MRRPALAAAAVGAALACAMPAPRSPSTSSTEATRPAASAALPSDADVRLGETLLNEGRLDDARRAFEKAAQVAPKDPRPLVGVARIEVASGRSRDALPWLDRALAIGEDPATRALRGQVAAQARRFDEAAADLEASLARRPRNGEALCVLAVVEVNRGDDLGVREAYRGAVDVLGKDGARDRFWSLLLSMPPDPVQPQEALDRCSRGYAAMMEESWMEAQHEQLNGLRKSPRFNWCLAGVGETTWRLGQAERAEGIFRRLLEAGDAGRPDLHADAKARLAAVILDRKGDATEAVALTRAAVAARGERPALLDLLGRACDAAGDAACARDAYAKLLGARRLPGDVRARAEGRIAALGTAATPAKASP
jgi:tetratricopeptide (TPR) repeat protein